MDTPSFGGKHRRTSRSRSSRRRVSRSRTSRSSRRGSAASLKKLTLTQARRLVGKSFTGAQDNGYRYKAELAKHLERFHIVRVMGDVVKFKASWGTFEGKYDARQRSVVVGSGSDPVYVLP